MQEKTFEKYKTRGADYHWKEINCLNPLAFNAYLHARYEIISKIISKIISEKSISNKVISIADFGCGDGVQLHLIKTLNKISGNLDLYGIDLSPDAIEAAKLRISGAHFTVASTYETGFSEEYFDISVSSDVIEHVLDPGKMITEMIRSTKPGGHIIIATPIKYTENPLDSMHVQEFFPNEFSRLFEDRNDIKIIEHVLSHPLKNTLHYNQTTHIFGKDIPISKYITNMLFLLINFNPFRKRIAARVNKHTLMTYQFVVLVKK